MAALDFGSCAASSRIKAERYVSSRRSGLSTLIRVTWPFERMSADRPHRTLLSVEAIHAE